jgi:hypothetical protein
VSKVASGREARDQSVDRYLCSWVWLNPVFSRYVYSELIRPGLQAVAPGYGVDLVALSRHARAARRHRALVLAAVAGDVIALLVTIPVLFWSGSPVRALVAIPVALLVFVAVMAWHLAVVRARAVRALFGDGDPHDKAPALDAVTEKRLAGQDNANVVVFADGVPFVGAGKLLGRWKVHADTTRAAMDGDGQPRVIKPINAEDVQKALSLTIRGAGIADLRVHNRLFVAGEYTDTVAGLLPDPQAPPAPVVDRKVIRLAVNAPTEGARTYLCVEKHAMAGELVVNIFTRAVMVDTDLFVEFHAYVLLPLHPLVREAKGIPITRMGRFFSVVRDTVPFSRTKIREVFGTIAEIARFRWRLARRITVQRRRTQRMQHFNYGAEGGVRAILAAKQQEWLYVYADQEMYVHSLRARILNAVIDVIDTHGIDTTELKRQRTTIISKTYKIGEVKGRYVVIGDNSLLADLSGTSKAEEREEDDDSTDDGT